MSAQPFRRHIFPKNASLNRLAGAALVGGTWWTDSWVAGPWRRCVGNGRRHAFSRSQPVIARPGALPRWWYASGAAASYRKPKCGVSKSNLKRCCVLPSGWDPPFARSWWCWRQIWRVTLLDAKQHRPDHYVLAASSAVQPVLRGRRVRENVASGSSLQNQR